MPIVGRMRSWSLHGYSMYESNDLIHWTMSVFVIGVIQKNPRAAITTLSDVIDVQFFFALNWFPQGLNTEYAF